MIQKNALPLLMLLLLSACGSGASRGQVPQDRNGPCYLDSHCLAGFTCEGAAPDAPGTCQQRCAHDSDCGNGALCRSGQCRKDCAEVGEKCSQRRVCCFFDEDDDRETDVRCIRDAGDERCTVGAPPVGAP